ncbi:MAG: hypothetical protein ACK5LE_06875 [Alphaproteobacteria bacterium]
MEKHKQWLIHTGILIVILLLVYPFDLTAGRIVLGILAVNLFYGWRRNWLQHLSALKWFDDMEGEDDSEPVDEV